eukprot:1175493-Pyramimonas_sp.AAC.1
MVLGLHVQELHPARERVVLRERASHLHARQADVERCKSAALRDADPALVLRNDLERLVRAPVADLLALLLDVLPGLLDFGPLPVHPVELELLLLGPHLDR